MRTLKTSIVSLYIDSSVLGCLKSDLDILKTCIETILITVNMDIRTVLYMHPSNIRQLMHDIVQGSFNNTTLSSLL
jgi:hypothetical protein